MIVTVSGAEIRTKTVTIMSSTFSAEQE